MVSLEELTTPCLIIDVEVAERNAAAMLERAAGLGCRLRPHVKTHKTVEGALLQTGGKKSCITVSTLREAEFFASHGFSDILYAVPITRDKLARAAELTRTAELAVMVDNAAHVRDLVKFGPPGEGRVWKVWVMVDCGYHRDGVEPSDPKAAALVQQIASHPELVFAGIYTHGGHSYDCKSSDAIELVSRAERDAVVSFASQLAAQGTPAPVVAIGSTPTCSVPPSDGLGGVTEMHPGNYLVYDVMQAGIGSCRVQDVALRVLTRVAGHYESRNTLQVDVGWTGLSAQGSANSYGMILDHPELAITNLKQEAGEVSSSSGAPLDITRYPIGSMLQILPWHSCAASHQHAGMHVVRSGEVVGQWESCKGW
mmetsp:Transcript_58405/g.156124  ORF Transcript_58405/g.156124 Transcript_58405/m.156124 type:complete len:369 (+) Transcript_58405:29-1135(+)